MKKKANQSKSTEDFIKAWTQGPFPKEVQKEANSVLETFLKGESNSEVEAYTIPLEFGTGGIRGVLGNGIGRMNVYTVGRAALGLSRFLASKYKKSTMVIAYDSRRKSKEFAEVTAGIAALHGIKVKVFPAVTPTPLLSYAIRHYKAQGGVVITASHNPPQYNGFKAYLEDGGQLVPPDDAKIIKAINDVTDWNDVQLLKTTDPIYKKFVSPVEKTVFETYKKKVFSSPIYNKKLSKKDRESLRIVYSPLHGTGGVYMKDLLQSAGYKNVFLVPEQEKPNGEFPTVKYPNPEEKEALVLCEKTSREKKASIFIATDPDADRLGIGLRDENDNFQLLNGNQVGSILCAYLSEKVRAAGKSEFNYHIFKTIVTTDLQLSIAQKNKIKIKDVLTGFKYIANAMNQIQKNPKNKFLFGGEESYGYLPLDFVRDKDSLSSALLVLEVLAEKKDLLAYLDEIYLKYGLYLESLKSISLEGEAGKLKIKNSLESLRKSNLVGKSIGKRKVIAVLDYKNKEAKGEAKKTAFSGLPSSDVIQLILSGNGKLTIRPSGTEPKVKLYSSFESLKSPGSREEIPGLKESLKSEILEAESQFVKMAGLDG
ncbi:MAG: phospho-sugar mutase [Leptospiraceae bacterium]|nr:phospho-sugar mutase [Leptospiraceae bacterium]MCP5512776.1 phospho-sugar mutase [Leptospiraceae bacterium]